LAPTRKTYSCRKRDKREKWIEERYEEQADRQFTDRQIKRKIDTHDPYKIYSMFFLINRVKNASQERSK
jgi:hypothetical protein